MEETIVVIGANHGGTAVLNTILDQFPGKRVVAFDRNSNISFLGCGMALWIGGQISGPEGLFYSSKEAFEEKGAVIHMETEVTRIDFDGKVVYARGKGGEDFVQEYDKLILATGSVPLRPEIEGMELDNVQFVKLYQNARDVIEKLKDTSVKKVAVVGAGYIGVELEGGRRVERVVTDQGCYEADMVVFGIGFKPNTALGQGKLRTFGNGAFLVDRRQETSVPGVYAVGDCATVYNNAIQAADYIALATNAVRSGIIAAHNACGKVLESVGVQGSNGISIWGFHMLSTGISLARAERMGYDAAAADYEDWQKAEFMENGNHKVKIRIVYDRKSRIILGAQMCSDYDVSMGIHMFSMAVEEQVTIDKLKLFDLFFLPHFNKPYNYVTMAALGAE